jgi:hypothetical protein
MILIEDKMKNQDRYKRAVKRKLDGDEEIIDDSDHGSENVANILLDLSTSEIPVMKIEKGINIYTYTYETLINNVNINKSNVLLILYLI